MMLPAADQLRFLRDDLRALLTDARRALKVPLLDASSRSRETLRLLGRGVDGFMTAEPGPVLCAIRYAFDLGWCVFSVALVRNREAEVQALQRQLDNARQCMGAAVLPPGELARLETEFRLAEADILAAGKEVRELLASNGEVRELLLSIGRNSLAGPMLPLLLTCAELGRCPDPPYVFPSEAVLGLVAADRAMRGTDEELLYVLTDAESLPRLLDCAEFLLQMVDNVLPADDGGRLLRFSGRVGRPTA